MHSLLLLLLLLLLSNVGTCCPCFLGWLSGTWVRVHLHMRPWCPCFLDGRPGDRDGCISTWGHGIPASQVNCLSVICQREVLVSLLLGWLPASCFLSWLVVSTCKCSSFLPILKCIYALCIWINFESFRVILPCLIPKLAALLQTIQNLNLKMNLNSSHSRWPLETAHNTVCSCHYF